MIKINWPALVFTALLVIFTAFIFVIQSRLTNTPRYSLDSCEQVNGVTKCYYRDNKTSNIIVIDGQEMNIQILKEFNNE